VDIVDLCLAEWAIIDHMVRNPVTPIPDFYLPPPPCPAAQDSPPAESIVDGRKRKLLGNHLEEASQTPKKWLKTAFPQRQGPCVTSFAAGKVRHKQTQTVHD